MADLLKQKRKSYAAGFKLKVISFAEESNNCAASRQFGIDEKLIRDWRKNKAKLENIPKSKKALRYGKTPFSELEKDLNDWIVECRQNGYIVTRTGIRLRAMKLSKDIKYGIPSTFRASPHWCTRFLNRHGLCLRQRTKLAQKLPSDLEEKILRFQKYIIDARKRTAFEISQIGNMDETPMCFDLPENKTINCKGEKSILVKTTGHEKTRFTVVLSCLADGSKLRPIIIFKRKTLPKNVVFPSGVLVRAHEKGWMDADGTVDWLKNVWNKRPGAAFKKPSLLVYDSFRGHFSEEVTELQKNLKTTVAVNPGGLTSVLQPLDVCLNKPFKANIRKYWAEWISSDRPAFTKGGNLKKPDITLIAQWVKQAWNEIPPEMIIKSFKKCCISNKLDGTEDDVVFQSEDTDDEYLKNTDELEAENIYDDEPMTEKEFYEMFGESDDESEFEGF